MRHKNINHVVHDWLKEIISPNDVIVDATCGQGYDTQFCLELGAKVVSFDIQEQALIWAKRLIGDHPHVEFIHDSHEHLDHHVTSMDGIIFNLGYLPNSNKNIITTSKSTIMAFEKAYKLLSSHGWCCVTFYQGHVGGVEETNLGIAWLNEHFDIEKEYTYEGVKLAPIALLCKKKGT
jgi:SAM-dependent methyltransferase